MQHRHEDRCDVVHNTVDDKVRGHVGFLLRGRKR